MTTQSIVAGDLTITVEGEWEPFRVSLSQSTPEPGIQLVDLRLSVATPTPPPKLRLRWEIPIRDIHAHWNPLSDYRKALDVEWAMPYAVKVTSGAPVTSLYSFSGLNRLTFALSDALNEVLMRAGVHEESAQIYCSFDFFTDTVPPLQHYEASLRLDTREMPYYESLNDVQAWWAAMPGYTPANVPDTARLPMYSTWYSFHQNLDTAEIEEQCKLAKTLGCEAVIVDDGWQTLNRDRGYAYCGDWNPVPEVFSDIHAHIERVHALGMKYLLWFSVPFIGRYSAAWDQFATKLLDIGQDDWRVLDPRYEDTRAYLIGIYERALKEWGLDGLKLDFVDAFPTPRNETKDSKRDYESVPEAVDRLLSDTMQRLRRIKADIMIEFRQTYVGPLMRKYGNMFRAGDCPNNSLTNRVRILDIRLLAGNTAVHSDMLMWHPSDRVESAAMQIVNSLFSVPQISVLIDKLPADHLEMLNFWLGFWRTHRDVLLDGHLVPLHPESLYPLVSACNGPKTVIVAYSNTILTLLDAKSSTHILINGTLGNKLIADCMEPLGLRQMTIRDCCGKVVQRGEINLMPGLFKLNIPPAGLAVLEQ
ncbi:MAG TPA: glycoside hydrolase family 36 protein [Aggregatilineales bacterium]|nr:glycoside hydrolase family 36 protein [Aggregatilineales bacterium]